MNFNKLSATEKQGVYGAVAVIVGAAVGTTASAIGWLALLAAIGMLAVIFLPQVSPQTGLPGSRGSLMLLCGAVAGVVMLLALLTAIGWLGLYFSALPIQSIFFLVAVAGGLLMAWAGWQAFRAEGGAFRIGTGSGG
jgi:threonine/homoserine/homoserine lactone efflux protein